MPRPKLKLIRGDLSNPDVDQALDAFYVYVLPLMPEDEKLFHKAHELLLASLIADYVIRNPDLGIFKDEVEVALRLLLKLAMALIPHTIIPD
jgi:hypothetical protein